MNISPTTLALIATLSTLTGVIISSAFNLINTRIIKKSEEQKHYRELVIKAAIENWKESCAFARATNAEETIEPLDDYIVHMIKFSELILSEKLDPKTIEKKLMEVSDLSRTISEFRNRQDRENVGKMTPQPRA